MKKKFIILLAVVLLIQLPVTAQASSAPFVDVTEGAWYEQYVEYVYSNSLMKGTTDTTFSPEGTMTRAMLATVLYRMEGCPETGTYTPFTDLREGAYYEDAVAWAYENGIVNGVSKSAFAPDENVTREQIVTILYRYAAFLGRDVSAQTELYNYYDLVNISEYAWDAFRWAVAEGIINGSENRLTPQRDTLRCQCAAILSRFLEESMALPKQLWQPAEPVQVTPTGNQSLYILMYHSVLPDGSPSGEWSVNLSKFRRDMQWLTDHGYTTVLPSELAEGMPLPKKAVLITFDDGYADNYRLAFPVLLEYGHKAVISVVTSYIGGADAQFLTWQMCQRMAGSGLVEFGSHTHDLHINPGICRLKGETKQEYQERVFADLLNSSSLLEEKLGQKPLFFAYPHGISDPWAREFIEEEYEITVITDSGVNNISSGLYELLRYNVNNSVSLGRILP